MAVIFPPSSPVAAAPIESDILESDSEKYVLKEVRNRTAAPPSNGWYPTPDPSSSLGRSSSPIRISAAQSSSPERLGLPLENRSSQQVIIELDPRNASRLAIGRKKNVCDIILPSKKSISRQHAFISYTSENNQVKLECNSANGCIVALPRQIGCQLIKPCPSRPVFELRAKSEMDYYSEQALHGKDLVTNHLLTSFVLLKGELVIMPYVEGTVLDFRQAEAVLTMKHSDFSRAENEDSATETEDEMVAVPTKSDDFHHVNSTPTKFATIEHSPATVQLSKEQELDNSNRVPCQGLSSPLSHKTSATETPLIVALNPKTPSTPTKPKKLDLLLNNDVQNHETPLSKHSNNSTRRRNWNTAFLKDSQPNVKSKHNKNFSRQKRSRLETTIETTPEALLDSMEHRGIKCAELQRILANHLAFANILQTPLYQLQTVNSTISTLSREELQALLAKERCIGVIHREGKDASGKPLDEEYFYDVENDDDVERRDLVFSFKGGRSGLRSCRKVHKQYFWKKPAK